MVSAGNEEFLKGRIELAMTIVEEAKNAKPTSEDASMNRRVYIIDRKNGPAMVHYVDMPDMALDDYRYWVENYLTIVKEIMKDEPKMEINDLEENKGNGSFVFHQRMKPGVPLVSNRS